MMCRGHGPIQTRDHCKIRVQETFGRLSKETLLFQLGFVLDKPQEEPIRVPYSHYFGKVPHDRLVGTMVLLHCRTFHDGEQVEQRKKFMSTKNFVRTFYCTHMKTDVDLNNND